MSETVDDFLIHYGVKGMRWGTRTGRPAGTPRKTEREASRDAKEMARAKMFYGEGAGIRRRHIKNAVESKSKDPIYKEAFERNLANQDLAKAGTKARSERKRKDTKNATVKTAKGVRHIMNGNSQYANITAAALVAGATYAHQKGYTTKALNAGKQFLAEERVRQQMKNFLKDL